MEPSMRPINSPGQTQNVKWLDGNVQGNRVNTPTASNMPIANYPQIETPATQTGQKPIDNRPQSILPKHEAKRSPMKALLVILIILNIVFVGLFGYYVNKSNSLSDEISDQEEEYDILLDENDEMDKNNKKLAKDKKQLEVEFSDIYQQYNTSKSDYESLDENYSTLESTNDNLNEELDTLKINYSELQAELDKLQDEYDELNQTYYDLIEYYYNQTEVLTRDRKIYREFKGTYDWPGHTSQFFYTLEGYLSDYFESLQRDHSFDYLNKESVIKFTKTLEKDNFRDQDLLNSFPDDEDLANAILDIVQVLEYRKDPPGIEDVRYPVETLIEGCGDCEDLAILCASMFEGNDLDAILLAWPGHFNTAVYLPNTPTTDSGNAWYIEYNNKNYYFCEPTGDDTDIGRLIEDHQNQVPLEIYEV